MTTTAAPRDTAGRERAPREFPLRIDVVGAVVGLVLLGVWVLARTGVARSVIGSPQALGILAAAGLLSVLIGVGVWRVSRRPLLSRGLALVPLLAVFGWSEVLPMLREPVVGNDADPLAASAPVSADAGSFATQTTAVPVAPTPPPSAAAQSPSAAESPSAEPAPPPPPAPVLLGSAGVVGIDHSAGGTAKLIRDASGGLVVRFEDFSVEPGPDYLLYVVPSAGATTPDGGTGLGEFDVTAGAVNVAVPTGFDASGPVTVLIWCRAYAVPVAHAAVLP